jgi:hypothetical protein
LDRLEETALSDRGNVLYQTRLQQFAEKGARKGVKKSVGKSQK